MKKTLPFINISKLISNVHASTVYKNSSIKLPNKLEYLFQLHMNYFDMKYQPHIEKNVIVNDLLFDLKI